MSYIREDGRRFVPAPVRIALQRAEWRRLEYNITGVWPGGKVAVSVVKYPSPPSLKQTILQLLMESPLTTGQLHAKIPEFDYECTLKRIYELQQSGHIAREVDCRGSAWVVTKEAAVTKRHEDGWRPPGRLRGTPRVAV